MQCQDTSGQLPAIHVDRQVLELAQELMPIIDAIGKQSPKGSILLSIEHGFVSAIDFTARRFRKKPKTGE